MYSENKEKMKCEEKWGLKWCKKESVHCELSSTNICCYKEQLHYCDPKKEQFIALIF